MVLNATEIVDPSGPSAASDVIKCVVMFYERGASGNKSIRKKKFRAVLNGYYKTLRKIRETVR